MRVIRLAEAMSAWETGRFAGVVKHELLRQADALPLHEGVSQGGIADAADMDITVIKVVDRGGHILVQCGAFFHEIVGGCSCGEDPEPRHAYCELEVSIDKRTATAAVQVRPG